MPTFSKHSHSFIDNFLISPMMKEESAKDKLLLCLGKYPDDLVIDVLDKLSGQEWNEIVDLSHRQGISPVLYKRLKTISATIRIPDEILESLRRSYFQSAARNARLYRQLNKVLSDLRRASIPVIVLKGAHLAETVYRNIALRAMGDIDLLVKPTDLRKTSEILLSLGYNRMGEFSASHNHMDPFVKPGHSRIEIHYHIMLSALRKNVDLDGLWQKAQNARAGGVEVLVLSPEDLLLHLCSHIAIDHGFNRNLSHLYDIRQTIEFHRDKIDWRVVRERSRSWGAERSAYLVLSLTDKLLGLNLPEGFLQTLEPGRPDFDAFALSQKLLFYSGSPIATSLARLWGEYSMIEKAGHILKRIFPTKEEMALMSPVSESSLKIYLYYPLRIKNLMTRHFASVKRVLNRDEETLSALRVENQRNKLIDWLLSN